MNKVILTQEQAKIIEETKFALAGFSNEILVRCLNGEYEIEPSFKAGDWVTYNDEATDLVGKLVEGEKSKILQVDSSMYKHYQSIPYEYLRHATPSEIAEEKRRRWWNDRDRDVWELREGDVIKAKEDGLAFDVSSLNEVYLTELSIDELDERYLVVCLAENREDAEE